MFLRMQYALSFAGRKGKKAKMTKQKNSNDNMIHDSSSRKFRSCNSISCLTSAGTLSRPSGVTCWTSSSIVTCSMF